MERYTKEMLWWMVVFVTLIALTLTLFIVAEKAFPQDETTYYYDWGNDTWTQYETYNHNTGEWTRGTIVDMSPEPEPQFPSSQEIYEQSVQDSIEFRNWTDELREGYENVYREQ